MENTELQLSRAAELTERINANAQLTVESYIKVGRDLKTVRDEKLYEAYGYNTFEQYCDAKTRVKQRQAYNCIKVYETYGENLDAVQNISFTNLLALAATTDENRQELIDSGDAERLSARELQKKIDELEKRCEQLTLDLGEKSKEESKLEKMKAEMDKLRTELEAQKNIQARKDERIKELESKPVEVAVEKMSEKELDKIKNDAAKKAREDVKKLYEEELVRLRINADSDRVAAVKEAKKSAAEIERLKAENAVLQANAKKAPPTGEKERIRFYLEEVQRNFNAALETIGKLSEDEQDKLKGKLKAIVEKMGAML